MTKRDLPQWQTGWPDKPGVYIGFAETAERTDPPGIYVWDGETWSHSSGFYDHKVSHWMESDMQLPPPD